MQKDYFWNSSTCAWEINRYLKSIANDLVIICNEIIDAVAKSYENVYGTESINLNDKKATCKIDNYYILITLLLVTILSLINATCYYCIN